MLQTLILFLALCSVLSRKVGYSIYKFSDPDHVENQPLTNTFKITPSLKTWDTIDSPKKVSITSMVVDHHSDGSWYVPSYHEKYSIGWNRTTNNNQFLNRPYACNIRFIGIGLQSTLAGFEEGGTGYLTAGFTNEHKKQFWHGFDKNETNRLHCYYQTNKDTASEFQDKPKTLGLAIYCPVILDDEAGPFNFKSVMQQGYFCRPLSDYTVDLELHLRPSSFKDTSELDESKEVTADVQTVPAAPRLRQIRELMVIDHRPHAVCTVQTFRNSMSAAMLYMFVAYYQMMGWRVIVYDRFGFHQEHIKDLITLPGVDYYPYTIFQLTNPLKYNEQYKSKQTATDRTFYKDERWSRFYEGGPLADTADQDMDKSKTYDYARNEYSHLESLLIIDSDELFYCPQHSDSVEAQRKYQQNIMTEFQTQGIEEMRFARIVYAARNVSNDQGTNKNIKQCMQEAFKQKSLLNIMKCWSTATTGDNHIKSADLASVCPFHYNHLSCDGMRGGGKDFAIKTCRCKVGLELQNKFAFVPIPERCHLMHINENRYHFQTMKNKGEHAKGSVTEYNPLVKLLESYKP